MDFPVESYSFLPGSRAILDLSYRSRLRFMSQQSRPTMSMDPKYYESYDPKYYEDYDPKYYEDCDPKYYEDYETF